jgi:hypothetical protein
VVVDLLDVVEKIKKTPVVVGDCTGFTVNRMLFPYAQAATLLVERGADLYQIDRAITEFGMPMGPFRLRRIILTHACSSHLYLIVASYNMIELLAFVHADWLTWLVSIFTIFLREAINQRLSH